MAIPNVSSLYQRINKGAEGGQEFARIINQLLTSDSDKEGYIFKSHSDAAGDFKGVDALMIKGINNYGLQYKWIPSSFQSKHKSDIKASFENAISRFEEMDTWILIVPEDLNKHDMDWIEGLSFQKGIPIQIWAHTKIINLMLRHRHIGEQYYPELIFRSFSLIPVESDFNYFEEFLKPAADISILFLKAQPTLADCKAVFNANFYREVCDVYYLQYRNLIDGVADQYSINTKKAFKVTSNTYREMKEKKLTLPGGVDETLNILNEGTTFYSVSFSDVKDEPGVSFWVWCFLDGRWVFFPKPNRVLRSITTMREDKDLKCMIKLLRWLGFDKKLEKYHKNRSILVVNHIANTLASK